MTAEYKTIKEYILKIVNKYAKHIQVGDFLDIKENLDLMEKRYIDLVNYSNDKDIKIESLKSQLEQQTHNAKYWRDRVDQINKMSFKDKLKFLFNKYD